MIYRVTKKFEPRGAETHVGNYKDLMTARAEIKKRLQADASLTIRAIYCIYEGFDIVEELDQSTLEKPQQTSSNTDESSAGMGGRFSPTPLPTAPRPSGMPPSSWKREDDQKDK